MKRITAIALCLILFAFLALPASAATAGTFLLKEYDVSADAVYCYGKQLPAGGTLTVSVGSRKVENAVFSTLEQEQIPVTVYCLVDIATSLPDSVMQQQEDILLTLSSQMERQDNMVLGLVDKSLTEGKLLSDKDTRDTAIETIQRQNWYTNLYEGMSQALDSICTNTTYHTNSCLVILTDGHDDGQTSVTEEQVLKKIQEAGIPVYPIVLGTTATQKELTYQEQFAAESLGGFLCRPAAEGLSAAAAAERVWDSVKGACAIRIGMEELQNMETDQELLIRYETGDARYEDTILIRAVDMVVPTTQPQSAEEPKVGGGDEEEFPLVFWIAAGLAALLLAAGAVTFVLLRKKKNRSQEPEPQPEPPIPYADDPVPGPDPFVDPDVPPQPEPENYGQTAPVPGGCHVFAVAIMHPEIAADFWLTPKAETTFGRNSQAGIVLCDKDRKLSGVHGSLLWDGKMLFVRDKNSTNGTAVNGEPCFGETWLRLEEGSTLRAGAYEYRISFRVMEENER